MSKVVYQTNGDGLFIFETVANALPLSPGAFNVPYGAYEDEPPSPVSGKWPRRVGAKWVMVEDFRSTPLWVVATGAPYTIGAEHVGSDGNVSYPGWGPLSAWLSDAPPK